MDGWIYKMVLIAGKKIVDYNLYGINKGNLPARKGSVFSINFLSFSRCRVLFCMRVTVEDL